jgi:hypothetical protein
MILALAVFAAVWIVFRAATQSITLDEAHTFLHWVHPPAATHWEPHSNNHVLNSCLMRLSVFFAGPSHLSIRAPALLGGFLYIAAATKLVRRLTPARLSQILLFLCLVFNPFVMDYLVAARGYGLAAAFFCLALIQILPPTKNPTRAAILLSTFTALSFCANFSTAYLNAVLWLAGLLTLWRHPDAAKPKLLLASILPGALVTLLLCGQALTGYDKGQLIWGADSLSKMLIEMRDASFDQINPHLANPILNKPFHLIHKHMLWLIPVLFAIGLWRFRNATSTLLATLFLSALALHYLQFRFFGILLPYERTSLLFVVLLTLALGTQNPNRLTNATLALCALYFLGSFRGHFFREWAINADIRATYPLILEEARRLGAREVISNLNYTPSLKVYRILENTKEIDEPADYVHPVPCKDIYVLPADLYTDFAQNEGLTLRYRSTVSDYSIWVREPFLKAQPH